MLEFIVLLILIVVFAFLISSIIFIPTFLINVGLILIIVLRLRVDLRENKMHVYYIWGAFLTAVMLVANEYGFLKVMSDFLFGNKVLYFTQAIILMFILAHLSAFIHSLFIKFREDMEKRKEAEEEVELKEENVKSHKLENAINPKKNLKEKSPKSPKTKKKKK